MLRRLTPTLARRYAMVRKTPRIAATQTRGTETSRAVDRSSARTYSGPVKDSTLAERAEKALRQRDFRFSRCVRCESHDGVLALHGRVPSYYLKQLAQATVAEIGEVERIENYLDVFVSTEASRRPR
jgi:osmotically-inducible protein OsmY